MVIKKQFKKLQDCLPDFEQDTQCRYSKISIVKQAVSYIEEAREKNKNLQRTNSSLADENMAIEQQIDAILERRKAGEVRAETGETGVSILSSSDSDEGSILFHEAVDFEENIAEFMIDDIINSHSGIWSLSKY